jgi:hypothetical protein
MNDVRLAALNYFTHGETIRPLVLSQPEGFGSHYSRVGNPDIEVADERNER